MSVRLVRFKCWWCSKTLGVRKIHHDVDADDVLRRCCNKCYCDPESNYRKTYEDEDQERLEVGEALQRREMKSWDRNGWTPLRS